MAQPADEPEVLSPGERLVDCRVLAREPDPQPDRLRMLGDVDAEDRPPALLHGKDRRQHPHRGGLPGAVRAEQTEHGALLDLERDAVERHDVAEALPEVLGDDRGSGHGRSACQTSPRPVRIAPRWQVREHVTGPLGSLLDMQMHQTMMGFRRDPDAVRGKRVERALLRRVLGLARPYRASLIGFLTTVVLSAAVGVVPALLFRALIDDAVANRNEALVLGLAAAAVAVAFANAMLSLFQRWYSARVGEGLIYDMRVALFDHVQRLPISFFTRVQTGALMSRLNGDVIGAQQAVTNTIGTVVQNIITLAFTLALMIGLEWRLTLLTLAVLPAFIIPARRIGRKLQVITRDGFMVDASMSNTIAERFNVAGALVVKLFGRQDRERDQFAERAARVRDIGVRSAMYSRVLMVALGFVAAVGTAIVYFVGGRMVIDDTITIGTLGALTLLVAQIYQPLTQLTNARVDVLTALVSFERVFEVIDFESLVAEKPAHVRPHRPDRAGRDRPRVVSPPRPRRGLARFPRRGNARVGDRTQRVDPARRQRHHRAR